MSTTEQHLKRIQDKLHQLLKQYAAVQKENSKLKEELDPGTTKNFSAAKKCRRIEATGKYIKSKCRGYE